MSKWRLRSETPATDREGLAVGWTELAAVIEGAAHADVLEGWDAGKTYMNMRQRIFTHSATYKLGWSV